MVKMLNFQIQPPCCSKSMFWPQDPGPLPTSKMESRVIIVIVAEGSILHIGRGCGCAYYKVLYNSKKYFWLLLDFSKTQWNCKKLCQKNQSTVKHV